MTEQGVTSFEKFLIVVVILLIAFISHSLINFDQEIVKCDKLASDGACLTECFETDYPQDDKYSYSLSGETKRREYCKIYINGDLIKKVR